LLAQGKAVPMIVVVPDGHALPFEPMPVTSYDFWTNIIPFWAKNQSAADDELFHDIIPFIQTRYSIRNEPQDRAIAGLSMGGLQAIETAIVHLGYFSWVGAFSPFSPTWVFSDEFKNALKEPNKINENLRLFEIITGEDDHMSGPTTIEFEGQLKQANIQHVYTLLPGTHSMFVWRSALSRFLQEIFKR
jgi:enterochelin esterase-like enzyme